MGTRAPVWTALLLWASCGGSDAPPPTPPDAPLHLVAQPESVAIHPSQSKDVVFRLLDPEGQPTAGRIIQFSILDDPGKPGNEAAGATLSFDRGITDGAGAVTMQIIAGPTATEFRLRASATRAPDLDVTVFVTNTTRAPVELAPVLVDPPVAGQELTTVRLYVLDGASCASVHYDNLPTGTPFVRTIPSEGTAIFSTVKTEVAHQLVGLGVDGAGVVRASGCVDLPGSLLVVDVPLRVVLPLHLYRAAPEGSYDVVSRLDLRVGLAKNVDALADAWTELGLCPLDPGRLWLDCTIDALRTTESDPSDCHPADDEGALGNKLAARRGLPLPMPGNGQCRDKIDAMGRGSLGALVAGLWPAPPSPLMSRLPALGAELRQLFGTLELRSRLTIAATSERDQYQADHRLTGALFPMGVQPVLVDLVKAGAPVLDARFVPGNSRMIDLQLDSHGFTLRLGSVAAQAFARSSLVPRGGPADVTALVPALLSTATHDDAGTILTGCAALDAVLCADVGEARGCLLTACADGQAALRRKLEAGFAALDGDDLDLVLGGTAPIIDNDGDGHADALGSPGAPGLWSAEIRGHAGHSLLPGSWTATRR
jgi:hypothetical protein